MTSFIIHGFKLKGFGLTTFVKKTDGEGWNNFAFGLGRNKFCLTAAFSMRKPNEIYIDRVQQNQLCIENVPLSNHLEGTSKLVRIGLYAMKRMLPHVKFFTLQDDSHLFCNGGESGYSILMAYETILKYNQTWYQQKFGAILPGFIRIHDALSTQSTNTSAELIPITLNNKPVIFEVVPQSIMSRYLHSLSILDQPCEPFEKYVSLFPAIDVFRSEYEDSASPRDFIARIRSKFGKNKREYCLAVQSWFNKYIDLLGINIYSKDWYIPMEHVLEPTGYSEETMETANFNRMFAGGGARTRRRRKNNPFVWQVGPIQHRHGVSDIQTWNEDLK